MPGRSAIELEADEVVDAALAIFAEQGLAAVSMRSVGARIGVSPVPVYSRVGNKEALLDAMAERLLASMAPTPLEAEPWQDYARRWAGAIRCRLAETADIRLLLGNRRSPFVTASRPLIETLRADGFAPDAAVQACRLLLWAVVGFATVQGRRPGDRGRPTRRPGGDPGGVSAAEADLLFDMHVRYLVEGIEQDRT